MKLLSVLVLVVFLTGCGTIRMDQRKDGRPSLNLILSESKGCKEKISITGQKISYSKCF